MMSEMSVLLIDDHEVVRAGFKSLLGSSRKCSVFEASNAEEGYRSYQDKQPDVIVCDINMPGMGGIGLIRKIRSRDKQTGIIVLSMYDDASHVENMKRLGVNGYVTKRSAPSDLLKALDAVARNKYYFSKDLSGDQITSQTATGEIEILSKREFEVFILLAQGHAVAEISGELSISPKTASNHRDNIMHKLGVRNLVELSHYAIRHGLVAA